MEHLHKRSGGRHVIEAVNIMLDMHHYFDWGASIPVYINMMETAQKKSARAKLSILDNMLFAISTKAILASDCSPHTTDSWEEKEDA